MMSSWESNEKFAEMAKLSKETESVVEGFFKRNDDADFWAILGLKDLIEQGNAMWMECIKEYPNTPRPHEEYASYLIECCTDFRRAIHMKYIAKLITDNEKNPVDYCFRSLVQAFPRYLKRGIVNEKGALTTGFGNKSGNKTSKGPGEMPTNQHTTQRVAESTSDEFSAQAQDELGHEILKLHKVRCALQEATNGIKAGSSNIFLSFNIITFVAMIIVLAVLYSVYNVKFNARLDIVQSSNFASDCRYKYSLATICCLFWWGNVSGKFSISDVMDPIWQKAETFQSVLDQAFAYNELMLRFNKESRKAFDELLVWLSSLASKGENIYVLAKEMLDDSVSVTYFRSGTRLKPRRVPLTRALSYQYTVHLQLLSASNMSSLWSSDHRFEMLIASQPETSRVFMKLQLTLTNTQREKSDADDSTLWKVAIAVPLTMFVATFTGFLVSTFLYAHEIGMLIKTIFKIPDDARKSASEPIRQVSQNESRDDDSLPTRHSSLSVVALYICIFFVLNAVFAVFVLMLILTASTMNTDFHRMASFQYANAIQSPLMVDTMIALSNALFLTDASIVTNSTTAEEQRNITQEWVDLLADSLEALLIESDSSPALIGLDPRIDDIMIRKSCVPERYNASFHDMYTCGSCSQHIRYLRDMVSDALVKLDTYEGVFHDEIPVNAIHLVFTHAIPFALEVGDILNEILFRKIDEFHRGMIIYFLLGLFLAIAIFIIARFFLRTLDKAFYTVILLIRRIPPNAIIRTPELFAYISNTRRSESSSDSSAASAIIKNSARGIFCINSVDEVESINPAFTRILGFTGEQMKGRKYSTLLVESNRTQIEDQLKNMRVYNTQSFSGKLSFIADNAKEVPCSATIMPMDSEEDAAPEFFVFIFANESQFIEKQKEVETERAKAEDLHNQILPREINQRMDSSNELSFLVPSASVMFINIVKFSDYALGLRADQIIDSLTTLFSRLDQILAKYSMLTKVRSIGDIYLSASGIFHPSEPTVTHTQQIIKFGLEAIVVLEEINTTLNSSFKMRIGVNTGGPIVAGVIGREKAYFEIFGRPISVAYRLQSQGSAGRIQISQATYDIISALDFQIAPRGEIRMKDNTMVPVYLVGTTQGFQFPSVMGAAPA
jgi:PAS domain S-box-containing protein